MMTSFVKRSTAEIYVPNISVYNGPEVYSLLARYGLCQMSVILTIWCICYWFDSIIISQKVHVAVKTLLCMCLCHWKFEEYIGVCARGMIHDKTHLIRSHRFSQAQCNLTVRNCDLKHQSFNFIIVIVIRIIVVIIIVIIITFHHLHFPQVVPGLAQPFSAESWLIIPFMAHYFPYSYDALQPFHR